MRARINSRAKMCNKYWKHGRPSFSYIINFICLAYFHLKKYTCKCKIDSFLSFRLINFFVRMLHCAETLTLLENMKKTPFTFSKIAEIFSTAKSARLSSWPHS